MTKSTYVKEKQKVDPSNVARSAIKTLSNSHRFNLMKVLLSTKRDLCVNELSEAIGISQSATSHQLSFLEAQGVVKSVRTGKTKCYLPTDTKLTEKIAKVIESLK
ncbi:MAG: winged helix-turn-helix domain-containing protein [Candidatus Campbellbacteria bacterium]|nr:winged helix-turn-helix domain-containing protein [Candidatus Campbellbacteria bacterium]